MLDPTPPPWHSLLYFQTLLFLFSHVFFKRPLKIYSNCKIKIQILWNFRQFCFYFSGCSSWQPTDEDKCPSFDYFPGRWYGTKVLQQWIHWKPETGLTLIFIVLTKHEIDNNNKGFMSWCFNRGARQFGRYWPSSSPRLTS